MVKHKPPSPMPVAERAKQFMPFAAVRGLNTALYRKEQELSQSPPKIMAEEAAAELDAKLRQLQKGSQVTVTFFQAGQYVQIAGQVQALDNVKRQLVLVEGTAKLRVAFADIIELI